MTVLRLFWNQLYDLAVTTVTVWWRLLPKLLIIQLLGWAALNGALRFGAFTTQYVPWAAVAILAIGLVGLLMAYIASLRLIGQELGINDVAPTPSGRSLADTSLLNVLAATLLPFLGIYAAFNYVEQEAGQMFILAGFMSGGALGPTPMDSINPLRSQQAAVVTIVVLVGIYVVRRALDLGYERTRWRPLGLLAAFLEATFLLVLIFSGQRLIGQLRLWWKGRAFHDWLDLLGAGFTLSLEPLRINLPEVIRTVGGVLSTAWSYLLGGTLEPLAWLAVGALVFGTHVLSLAEMWGKGQPLATQVIPRTRLAKPKASTTTTSGVPRRALLELQSVFFGDVDDRYLPTLQAIRIVIRPGLTFLAAYLLLYAVLTRANDWLDSTLVEATGGQPIDFWIRWQPYLDLFLTLVYQPLILALFGVTFQRCLMRLRTKTSKSAPVSVTATGGAQRQQFPGPHELAQPMPAPLAPRSRQPQVPAQSGQPMGRQQR